MSGLHLYLYLLLLVLVVALQMFYLSSHTPSPASSLPCPHHPTTTNTKRIVFWTRFYRHNYDTMFPPDLDEFTLTCGEHRCEYSRDRTDPERYDAFIFHTRDKQFPPATRRPDQVYIAYTMEAPYKQEDRFMPGPFYNWTMLPSRHATVRLKYFDMKPVRPKVGLQRYNQYLDRFKSKKSPGHQEATVLVLWVASQCSTDGYREHYVRRLRQVMPVDVYGKCGKPCVGAHNSDLCIETLAQQGNYKFYLAFENAICEDYITEKVSRPLMVGLVPIVLGGLSSTDYTHLLPNHSYIDTRDFSTPGHLADYLYKLDGDDQLYLRYHQWRTQYQVARLHSPTYMGWLCQLCEAVHDPRLTRVSRTVDWAQFYTVNKFCDAQLVSRLIKPAAPGGNKLEKPTH